jgi:predicted amidohydrolase
MNEKTLAAVALSNRNYGSFEEKLAEAVRWVDFSASQGADLVVLPEALNFYRGDGDTGSAEALLAETRATMKNWQERTQVLFQAAIRNQMALTIPLVVPQEDHLVNCFFLLSSAGEILGQYQKMYPTPGELEAGVRPGKNALIEWDGLKIGGAICFDCYFPQVFERQAEAQLFLACSFTPGGAHLNFHAMNQSTPIALAYPAYSRIIDIDGRELDGAGYRHETLRLGFGAPVALATLNFDRVALYGDYNQQKILAIQEEYGEKVRIRFDQASVTFYLESRSNDLTVNEVMQRFELIPSQRYFQESARLVDSYSRY